MPPNEQRWLAYGSPDLAWTLDHSSAAHSIYFQMLGQHGFVALLLYLTLLFGALLSLSRIKKRALANKDTAWAASYANGIQVGLVGYMVSGAFLSSAYFDLAWLYFALTAILAREVIPVASRHYGLTPSFGGAASGQPAAAPGAAMAASGERNVGRSALKDEARGIAPRKSAT